MSIQIVTLKRALAMLDAVGAKYKVVASDGNVFNTLPAESTKKRGPHRNAFKQSGYIQEIAKLSKGDSAKFSANGFALDRFRAAIAAQGVTRFGRRACVTHVDRKNKTVEILRVE